MSSSYRPSADSPFETVRIRLASTQEIRNWAIRRFWNGQCLGEVTTAETLNYRTLKPVFHGLFCERLFGPVKNWECQCGRLKFPRPPRAELWCPTCVVQITRAVHRRTRMGFIRLGTPVLHIWYRKGFRATNPLARLFFFTTKEMNFVLDARLFVVSSLQIVSHATLPCQLYTFWEWRLKALGYFSGDPRSHDKKAPWSMNWDYSSCSLLDNTSTYGFFELLRRSDLESIAHYFKTHLQSVRSHHVLLQKRKLAYHLRHSLSKRMHEKLVRKVRRQARQAYRHRQTLLSGFTMVRDFLEQNVHPASLFLWSLPVLPPDLRPIVQVGNGRFATSDINDLYRLVLHRNKRLLKFLTLGVPEIIAYQELRLVQHAVNAVLDNSRLKHPVCRSPVYDQFEPLKSLSDRVVGKKGRFRQNLLGKRVDYSGRSVIVVGPKLRLFECGIPKEMALELFQPFLLHHLITKKYATTTKGAKLFCLKYPLTTFQVLQKIVEGRPVLLNRAPTLHRMGIQAFFPRITESRAIQLHPFVCPAFNADFDGDQMAVHVPLRPEALVEARLLLLSPNNWLSPATGEPCLSPSQDMVLGFYYATLSAKAIPKSSRLRVFSTRNHVIQTYERESLRFHSPLWLSDDAFPSPFFQSTTSETHEPLAWCCVSTTGQSIKVYPSLISFENSFGQTRHHYMLTTVGRVLFNTLAYF